MRLVTLVYVMGTLSLCVLLPCSGFGEELSYTTDLTTLTPSAYSPSWLQQLPIDTQQAFAEAQFEITPPSQAADLLVTITYDEQPGGFLKVFWKSDGQSQMLSENLYEGIEMPNQRTLLISQLTLREKGRLTLQASQDNLHVYKIRWEWLEPKVIAAGGDAFALAAINANGKTLTTDEVSGDPLPAPADQWKGSIITAPLSDKPERIEQGIEFQAELEALPQSARLEGWLTGLPLDKNLTVWINGHSLNLSLEVPDLSDPGYQTSAQVPTYIGWRKLQLWVPVDWLQAGVNKLQFSWGEEIGKTPLAVKNLSFQLKFGDVADPLGAPVATSDSASLP